MDQLRNGPHITPPLRPEVTERLINHPYVSKRLSSQTTSSDHMLQTVLTINLDMFADMADLKAFITDLRGNEDRVELVTSHDVQHLIDIGTGDFHHIVARNDLVGRNCTDTDLGIVPDHTGWIAILNWLAKIRLAKAMLCQLAIRRPINNSSAPIFIISEKQRDGPPVVRSSFSFTLVL